jgi:transcriptional regulator with XRE-family HTH domain
MPIQVPPETFGELVQRMRRRVDMTHTTLGRRVGRTRQQVLKWEAGREVPEREVFPKLAAVIGVPLRTLLELAGLEPDGPEGADPDLSALADQAADMERRLRALATSPPSGDAKPAVFAKEGAKTKKKPGPKRATGGA